MGLEDKLVKTKSNPWSAIDQYAARALEGFPETKVDSFKSYAGVAFKTILSSALVAYGLDKIGIDNTEIAAVTLIPMIFLSQSRRFKNSSEKYSETYMSEKEVSDILYRVAEIGSAATRVPLYLAGKASTLYGTGGAFYSTIDSQPPEQIMGAAAASIGFTVLAGMQYASEDDPKNPTTLTQSIKNLGTSSVDFAKGFWQRVVAQ